MKLLAFLLGFSSSYNILRYRIVDYKSVDNPEKTKPFAIANAPSYSIRFVSFILAAFPWIYFTIALLVQRNIASILKTTAQQNFYFYF